MQSDGGWIRTLMDEAENERMFLLYLISSRTAHRMVGYFEEEAIVSYTAYLAEIESGRIENVAAPQIAIDYWKLGPDARLKEVVMAVRADEVGHRDVNHGFADELSQGHPPNSRSRQD
jgi:ubiquinol oxidase